jgi:hypothetical protein
MSLETVDYQKPTQRLMVFLAWVVTALGAVARLATTMSKQSITAVFLVAAVGKPVTVRRGQRQPHFVGMGELSVAAGAVLLILATIICNQVMGVMGS